MGKRPDRVYKKNAQRGAITRQCPKCQRKAAISRENNGYGNDRVGYTIIQHRKCRWCDFDEWVTTETAKKTKTTKRIDLETEIIEST